jgi:galactokinase
VDRHARSKSRPITHSNSIPMVRHSTGVAGRRAGGGVTGVRSGGGGGGGYFYTLLNDRRVWPPSQLTVGQKGP